MALPGRCTDLPRPLSGSWLGLVTINCAHILPTLLLSRATAPLQTKPLPSLTCRLPAPSRVGSWLPDKTLPANSIQCFQVLKKKSIFFFTGLISRKSLPRLKFPISHCHLLSEAQCSENQEISTQSPLGGLNIFRGLTFQHITGNVVQLLSCSWTGGFFPHCAESYKMIWNKITLHVEILAKDYQLSLKEYRMNRSCLRIILPVLTVGKQKAELY